MTDARKAALAFLDEHLKINFDAMKSGIINDEPILHLASSQLSLLFMVVMAHQQLDASDMWGLMRHHGATDVAIDSAKQLIAPILKMMDE